MSEGEDQSVRSAVSEYRLLILVVGAIAISLMLVGIGIAMYANSPAAQLDLSRPGYKSVQTQAEQYTDFKEFPASGPIDAATLDDFKKLYDKQARDASGFDAFGSDALTDHSLHIDAPAPVE